MRKNSADAMRFCRKYGLYGFAPQAKDTSGPQEVVRELDTALRRNPLNPTGPNDDSWRDQKLAEIGQKTAGFRAGESAANEIRDRLLADAEAERIKREPTR